MLYHWKILKLDEDEYSNTTHNKACREILDNTLIKTQEMYLLFDWSTNVNNNQMTLWPSGLRRDVKAVVFIGVGSNPTGVTVLSIVPSL